MALTVGPEGHKDSYPFQQSPLANLLKHTLLIFIHQLAAFHTETPEGMSREAEGEACL